LGGENLYRFVDNNPLYYFDDKGEGLVATTSIAIWAAILIKKAVDSLIDLILAWKQGEINIDDQKKKYENLLDEDKCKKSYRKGKSCAEQCRKANLQVLDSAGKASAATAEGTPGTTLTGPIADPQPFNPVNRIPKANSTITGGRPGFKPVTGHVKKLPNGKKIFVHKYHRSAPGGTPIPKNFNKQYPKPKIKVD
jgi:hypothetical protein